MARDSGAAARSGGDRLHHLDALRGIAAFAVVLHHALLALPTMDPLPSALHAMLVLRIVELGRPAVVLFFVLSGFVLTLCLEPAREGLVGFAVRRAARLLPPYWAAIILSFLLYRMVSHHHAAALSAWLASQWDTPLSGGGLGQHLAMRAGPAQFPLDHVAWSLVHELRLSLVVPLLLLVAARRGSAACLALTMAVAAAANLVVALHPAAFPIGFHGFRFDAEGLGASLLLSARYAPCFAIGVVLARHRALLAKRLAGRRRLAALGLASSLVLMSQPDEMLMTIGSGGLLAIVASSATCARLLNMAPLVWLGRTSYSLYLVHLPLMLACGFAFDGMLAPRATLALAILVALVAAELMFRLVEQPSIRWSRALGKALAARRPEVALPTATPCAAEI